MKALVGAFNQEKALVGAFSVIVHPVVEPMDRFTALIRKHLQKGEVEEDKVILINREGRVTEVAADMLDMEEDVMV